MARGTIIKSVYDYRVSPLSLQPLTLSLFRQGEGITSINRLPLLTTGLQGRLVLRRGPSRPWLDGLERRVGAIGRSYARRGRWYSPS